MGAWDSLIVDLKVTSKYSEQYKIHLPYSYEVVKVHKIDYRPDEKQNKIL